MQHSTIRIKSGADGHVVCTAAPKIVVQGDLLNVAIYIHVEDSNTRGHIKEYRNPVGFLHRTSRRTQGLTSS